MFKQKKEPDTQIFKDSEGGIKGITMGGDAEFKKAMSEAMDEGIKESENMKRLGLDPSKKGDFDKYEKMKADGQLEKNVTEEIDISQGMIDLDEMNFTKNAQAAKKAIDSMSDADLLMKKYPGMDKKLADQIANDTDPNRKANVIAMVEQTFKLSEKGKSGDEIIEIFKKGTDRTEQADGGITRLRNGYYGGGQAMVGEDLSQIGHGADALMARNMQLAPNSMATTSTGLNYLLGEDNDTVRVPYRDGLEVKVPPSKPYTTEMFEDDSMTLLQGMYGTGKDSNEFLYNEIIKKGNKLREKGVDRETVIEIIKNNKDKIDMILKQQTGDKKSLAGLADGGIAGLRKGYAGGKGVDIARRGFLKILGGSVAAATAFKMGLVKMLGKESGAVSKKAVDQFFASGTSGAPTWFEPLVNKALKEGLDITEKAAIKDGQIVKQLDTPTGKVDVTYDTRTGAVDVDYMGGDTAMGEGLQMRYAPGDIIEEGAKKGQKSDDVFEAVESIPEFQGGNYMDGPDLGFGENMTSNIDDLYSDTSELATLGGEKLLVKDISNTLKKKKVLKEMDNNPQEFAQDMSPDVYYDD